MGLVNTFYPMIVPTWFCMGIASVYGGGMFNIFLLRQFIRTIPRELDEAAYVDGGGHLAVFTRIILPLSKPSLTCVGLFTFLNSWNDLINPLIYINSDKKFTIQLGLRTFNDGGGLHGNPAGGAGVCLRPAVLRGGDCHYGAERIRGIALGEIMAGMDEGER